MIGCWAPAPIGSLRIQAVSFIEAIGHRCAYRRDQQISGIRNASSASRRRSLHPGLRAGLLRIAAPAPRGQIHQRQEPPARGAAENQRHQETHWVEGALLEQAGGPLDPPHHL